MKIINIRNYQPKETDIFIFDSNIWVYLFDKTCIPEQYIVNSIDEYTDFYKKVLLTRSKIYISSFNIQEISKKFIKNDFKSYKAANPELEDYKKEYRQSGAYNNLLSHIKSVNNEILKSALKINDDFENFEHSRFFNNDIDFVDEYLGFLSDRTNCKLVTHDSDFKNCQFNIQIITDNNKLLRQRNFV